MQTAEEDFHQFAGQFFLTWARKSCYGKHTGLGSFFSNRIGPGARGRRPENPERGEKARIPRVQTVKAMGGGTISSDSIPFE
jgi:hypothetical protein